MSCWHRYIPIGSTSCIEDDTKGLEWMIEAVPHPLMALVCVAIILGREVVWVKAVDET
jgi:hypothetical protein